MATKKHNAQNQHIMERLARATLAINTLISRGLTVTAVKLEGPYPQIDIMPGPACRDLKQAWTRYFNKAGSRQVERVALVGECQVRWLERE